MKPISSNKKGQSLGQKGKETRHRLMEAATRLLATISPFDLTVAAIAKDAKVATATFYVYFDDVPDLLYGLSADAAQDMTNVFEDDTLLRDPARLEEDALIFVRSFNAIWDRYANILLYRNLEADRGDHRFNQLRTHTAVPIMNALADRIDGAYPPADRPPRRESYTQAVVIFTAIERLAAATHQFPDQFFRPEQLARAQAQIIAHILAPR